MKHDPYPSSLGEYMQLSKKIAIFWNENKGKHLDSFEHWEANIPVSYHQNYRVTGQQTLTPLNWFYSKYGPFINAASIGSGTGILEKAICSIEEFDGEIRGYDISPHSIEVAAQNCSEFPNAFFEVRDLNCDTWGKGGFDVIFAHGALHHVEKLDFCLREMFSALSPEGFLYVNDYVGPKRFQWSDVQMRLANEMLKQIPSKWKKKTAVLRCDPEALAALDPSEAVCSHFIVDTINAYFYTIESFPRGGTLLAPIFGSGCLSPSILKSPEGWECLTKMAERESELIDKGILKSDHVVIIAKKRNLQHQERSKRGVTH